MKIICPEHSGVIVVPGPPNLSQSNVKISNLVVDCPVCEDEVLVDGIFDYDEQGVPVQVS